MTILIFIILAIVVAIIGGIIFYAKKSMMPTSGMPDSNKLSLIYYAANPFRTESAPVALAEEAKLYKQSATGLFITLSDIVMGYMGAQTTVLHIKTGSVSQVFRNHSRLPAHKQSMDEVKQARLFGLVYIRPASHSTEGQLQAALEVAPPVEPDFEIIELGQITQDQWSELQALAMPESFAREVVMSEFKEKYINVAEDVERITGAKSTSANYKVPFNPPEGYVSIADYFEKNIGKEITVVGRAYDSGVAGPNLSINRMPMAEAKTVVIRGIGDLWPKEYLKKDVVVTGILQIESAQPVQSRLYNWIITNPKIKLYEQSDVPSSFSRKIIHVDPISKQVLWTAMFNTDSSDPTRAVLIGKDGLQKDVRIKTYVSKEHSFAFEYPEFTGSTAEVVTETKKLKPDGVSAGDIHYYFKPPELSPNYWPEMITDRYVKIRYPSSVTLPNWEGMAKNKYETPYSDFGDMFGPGGGAAVQIDIDFPKNENSPWFSETFVRHIITESMRSYDHRKATYPDQLKAISIAEKKVWEKFPDFDHGDGKKLVLIKAVPGKWFIIYDVPTVTDASVRMIVDINTGEISEYQDSWA